MLGRNQEDSAAARLVPGIVMSILVGKAIPICTFTHQPVIGDLPTAGTDKLENSVDIGQRRIVVNINPLALRMFTIFLKKQYRPNFRGLMFQ